MIRKLQILLTLSAFLLTVSCSDEDKGLAEAPAPTISLPMEEIDVDLNKVDNPPVVAIIKSQAGLKNVTMEIETAEGINEYKTVTDFFNSASYSLSEELIYDNTYQAFIIKATDKQNQVTEGKILFNVTDVVGKPVIEFDPQEIIYDEMDENPVMPNTAFKVTSDGGLKNVSMLLVSSEGETEYKTEGLNGEKEYTFNELIEYTDKSRGLKVKAEDNYGNITIETLPVTYRSIPGPVITELQETVEASSNTDMEIPIKIESQRPIQKISVYANDDTGTAIFTDEPNRIGYDGKMKFTLAKDMYQVRVVVSDGRVEKDVEQIIKTYVDIEYFTIQMGSQSLQNNAHKDYPDVYSVYSVKDKKTYTTNYVMESRDNAKNVDFKYYCHSQGGILSHRLYAMDQTEKDRKDEETKDCFELQGLIYKTLTRFVKLDTDYDFNKLTADGIPDISNDSSRGNKLSDLKEGDCIAFITGTNSTSSARKGVMRITHITGRGELNSNTLNQTIITMECKLLK